LAFAHGDRRVEDGGVDLHLADLDALGDLHLALAREQRHAAHLAEVHANGIVALRVVVDVFRFATDTARQLLRLLLLGDAIFTWVAPSTIWMSSAVSAPTTSSI
jgi:hypothetical protein